MEKNRVKDSSVSFDKRELIFLVLILVSASYFVNIVARALAYNFEELEWIWRNVYLIKIGLIGLATVIYSTVNRQRGYLVVFAGILAALCLVEWSSDLFKRSEIYSGLFDLSTFAGTVGGNIAVKAVFAFGLAIILIFVFGWRSNAFLAFGDLSVKASEIKWLGIEGGKIYWGWLSIVSGLLISLGTAFLTIVTVVGVGAQMDFERLVKLFPLIIVLALGNSFSEGIVFRNAVIAPLTNHLPKGSVVMASAILFGSFHYDGVPAGWIGVIMSSVLGWFLARCFYETKGFLGAWIIHFMQDIVIFSSLVLMG